MKEQLQTPFLGIALCLEVFKAVPGPIEVLLRYVSGFAQTLCALKISNGIRNLSFSSCERSLGLGDLLGTRPVAHGIETGARSFGRRVRLRPFLGPRATFESLQASLLLFNPGPGLLVLSLDLRHIEANQRLLGAYHLTLLDEHGENTSTHLRSNLNLACFNGTGEEQRAIRATSPGCRGATGQRQSHRGESRERSVESPV
jgi:hypothetical protein